MDAFKSPGQAPDEIDFSAAKPGFLVTAAGVAQIVAGATCSTNALQAIALIWFPSWVLPTLMGFLLLAGAAQMALGAIASRGRDWAAIAGTALAWILQIIALTWLVYAFSGGFFSLLSLVWALLNGLASLLAPLGVPGALAASRARRALYAS